MDTGQLHSVWHLRGPHAPARTAGTHPLPLARPALVDVATARRWLKLILFSLTVLLVVLGSIGEISRQVFNRGTLLGFVHLFALGDEANAPTWFASAMLFFAGILAGLVALVYVHERNPVGKQWVLFASVLVLMSFDETASIHESPGWVIAYLVFWLGGYPGYIPWYIVYAWLPVGVVVVAGLVWWFSRLWTTLPATIRPQFNVAALVFFGSAVGIEGVEALGLWRFGDTLAYSAIWTLQETGEMVGLTLLILALYDYLVLNWTSVTLQLRAPDSGN